MTDHAGSTRLARNIDAVHDAPLVLRVKRLEFRWREDGDVELASADGLLGDSVCHEGLLDRDTEERRASRQDSRVRSGATLDGRTRHLELHRWNSGPEDLIAQVQLEVEAI